MRPARQKTQDILGEGDGRKARERVAVDCVVEKQPTRTQHARHLRQNLVQVGHMFEHIDTDDGIKVGRIIRKRLAHPYVISDAKAL